MTVLLVHVNSPTLSIKALPPCLLWGCAGGWGEVGLWTDVCHPSLAASIWNKVNLPFYQPGLFIGFWAASSCSEQPQRAARPPCILIANKSIDNVVLVSSVQQRRLMILKTQKDIWWSFPSSSNASHPALLSRAHYYHQFLWDIGYSLYSVQIQANIYLFSLSLFFSLTKTQRQQIHICSRVLPK